MRWFVVLVAVALPVAACAENTDERRVTPSTDTAPVAEPSPTGEPATPVFELDEYGTPSDAAVAADRAFRVVPDSHNDCGVAITTSGWPTTTTARPDAADCIAAAAAAGTPAQYAVTARDFAGGMDGTLFRVDGPGDLVEVDYLVAPDGAVTSETRECARLEVRPPSPRPACVND